MNYATIVRVSGKYERLCWERQERDLALAYPDGVPTSDDPDDWRRASRHPKGYWYDPEAAERPIQWIESLCRHHDGEWANQPFLLADFQRRVRRIVFGWQRPDGTRRFRSAYIEIPRKNGKTEDAAAGALYLAFGDGEPGAEVYSAATKKDQAKIAHDAACEMLNRSPELRAVVVRRWNNLHDPETGSKYEPLGADSDTLDGLNPHGVVVDELHAHKDRRVWDVLDTAMGARRQPLTWAITTAGLYNPESIGWQQHWKAINVLEGAETDDTFFAFIAAADDGADWRDPATWAQANPNIGVTPKWDHLAEQCRKAETQPSFRNTFLRLHLNRWTQQRDRWIPMEAWQATDPRELTPAGYAVWETELVGATCYGGLDLSTRLDITACVLAFEREETVHLVCRFWIPEDRIAERVRRDRVEYDAWVRDGWMQATPGSVVDYDFIKAEILALAQRYDLRELGYDPWNATQIALQLAAEGLVTVEVRQGYRTLSEPSKDFEAKVTARQIRHGGHPVLRWMIANVAHREDASGNIKPDKASSAERIDGVTAAVVAMSRLIAPSEAPVEYAVGSVGSPDPTPDDGEVYW